MNQRRYNMILEIIDKNEYLKTREEKQRAFVGIAGAFQWADKVDREARELRRRYANGSALTKLNHYRY